jgi:hypothetical protein
MANTLMEKQMQYAQNQKGPDLITTEEWLQLQDIPFKEMMLKRMGIQRIQDATTKFTKGLFDYASLVADGTDPNAAVGMVGENMAATETGGEEPYAIPPMNGLMQAAQGAPVEQQPADPLQAMQQDPIAALQQSAQTPGAQAGMQIDPEILAALGNIQ